MPDPFKTQSIFAVLESMSETVGRGGFTVPKGARVSRKTFFPEAGQSSAAKPAARFADTLKTDEGVGTITGDLSPSMFIQPPKPAGAMTGGSTPLERSAFSATRGGQSTTQHLIQTDPNSLEAIMAEWDRKVIGRETRGFNVPSAHAQARQAFRDQALASLHPDNRLRQDAKRMGMPDEATMKKLDPQLRGQGASLSDLSDPGVGLGDAFAKTAIQEAQDYGPLAAGMAHGAPQGAAGAAGAIAGAKLLTGRIPGIGGLLAPLVGAFGGAMLGAGAEQAVEAGVDSALKATGGEAFFATLRQGLQESMAQNPGMGQTGEILGASMAAFAPNPERVRLAGSHIAEWIRAGRGSRWAALNPDKVANIVDVAFGGTTEVGIEAVSQIQRGNLDPLRLAEAALIGTLFNEPNKLGRKFGAAPTNLEALRGTAPVEQAATPAQAAPTPTVEQVRVQPVAETQAQPAVQPEIKPVEQPQQAKPLHGKTVGKSFSRGNKTKIDVEERIVSLDDLIASHDHNTFQENPAFPVDDLQNRDRARAGSAATAKERAMHLDSELLTTDFRSHDKGSPIVASDGIVESGNGRIMSMRIAKEQGFDSWKAYQAKLRERFGADLDGIENPVLVRVRTSDLDPSARRDFVREANASTVEKLSPAEQAKQDSESLGEDFWDQLVPSDNGDFNATVQSARNRKLVGSFLSKTGDINEGLTADGDLSVHAVERIKRAGLHALFGDQRLAESMTEGDEVARRASSALFGTLSKLLKIKGRIANGEIDAELDPSDLIRKAFEYLRRQKDSGMNADDWFAHGDLVDPRDPAANDLALALAKAKSVKEAKAILTGLADEIREAPRAGTEDLFGDVAQAPSMATLVERAMKRGQESLFSPEAERVNRTFADELAEANAIEDPEARIAALLALREKRAKGTGSKRAGGTTLDADDFRLLGALIKSYIDLGVQSVEAIVRNVVGKLGEGYRDAAQRMAARMAAGEDAESVAADLMGSPDIARKKRIAPAAEPGPIRDTQEMVRELEVAMQKTTRHDKERKGMAGSFRPQDTRTNVARANDLPTTLHEHVHNMDDDLGLSQRAAQEPWWGDQVRNVAEYQASANPADNMAVERGEHLSELIVAYALDPATVQRLSPDALAWVKTNIPAEAWNAIESFGKGVRALAASKPEDLVASHVRTDKHKPSPVEKVREWMGQSETGEHKTSGFDQLRRVFTDDIAPVVSGVREALKRKGQVALPEDDPVIRLRQWRYMDQRVDDILKNGMVDSRGNRVTKGFADIIEPLDASSPEALDTDLKHMFAMMLSERVIEKARLLRDEFNANIKPLQDFLDAGGDGTVQWNGKQLDTEAVQLELKVLEIGHKQKVDNLGGWGRGIYSDLAEANAALDNLTADPDKIARLQEASKRYREWADSLLRYARDNGYISADDYTRIVMENDFYVSMAREGFEGLGQRSGGRGAGSRTQLFQKFDGSTRTIESPLASLMAQTHRVVREVDRNRALRAFRDILTNPPRRFGEDGRLPMEDIGRRVAPGDDQSIQIKVDGKTEYWRFEEGIHEALSDRGLGRDHWLIETALGFPANVLRAAITNFPAFAIRNRIRDSFDRVVKSRTGSPLFLPDKKGAALRKAEVAELYNQYGAGIGRGHYMDGANDWYRIQRTILGDATGAGKMRLWGPHVAKQYKHLIDSSEMAGRITEYQTAFEKAKREMGYDDLNAHMFAANEARDLIDFTRAGTLVRRLNRYVPFFNAGVQGSSRFFTSLKERPAQVLGKWLLYVGAPTAIEFAMNKDDEDYKQLPAYQKDLFWNFKLPDGTFLVIPKPFEFGVMGSGMRRLMDQANGDDKAFEGYGGSVARTLQPVDIEQFVGLGAWQSVAESFFLNRDLFRDRDVVPVWDEDKKLSLRDTSGASRLGQLLQQVFQVDARQIDHVVQGQLGYFGRFATDLSDLGRNDGKRRTTPEGLVRSATGLSKQLPTSNSRDVDWVLQTMRSYGIRGGKNLEKFRSLLDGAYGDAQKTRDLQETAKALREQLEAGMKGLDNDADRKKAVQNVMG